MRSRRPPAYDETAGHSSAMACHIGNVSYLEKRRAAWRKEWDL